MTGSRRGRIWGLVAGQAARRGGRVSAADVCAAAVAAVEVTGAWLNAASGAEAGHLMWVTDQVSEQLAELQLTLGEGPCLDAAASGGPVLASDLSEMEAAGRWPVFAPAARQAGAAAIFALPLRIGAIRAGVMGLYRERPGPLNAAQLGDALIFADTATLLLLDSQDPAAGSGTAGSGPGAQPEHMTGGWPTWPATSWRAACGCALTQTHPRTARRERLCNRQHAHRLPRTRGILLPLMRG